MSEVISVLYLNFFKKFGLVPNNLQNKKLLISKIYAIMMGIIMFVLVFSNITGLCITKVHKGRTKMIQISGMLGVVIYTIFVISAYSSMIIKAGLLQKICQNLTNLHAKLISLGAESRIKKIRRMNLLAIYLISSVTLFNSVYQLIFYSRAHFWVGISAMVVRIIMSLSMCYAFCVLNVVHSLWQDLDHILSEPLAPIFVQLKSCKQSTMKMLSDLQQDLFTVSNVVGEFFGPIFLTTFGSMAVFTIIHLYCIYYYIAAILRHDPDPWLYGRLIASSTMVVFGNFLIMGIAWICQRLTDVSVELDRKIFKLSAVHQSITSAGVRF